MSQELNQSSKGATKSTIAEIMEVFKDHPSIMMWVKNLIIFFVGFQIVIFFVVIFMMLKVSGSMDERHDKFTKMEQAFENHSAEFNKKFDEERTRMKKKLEERIEQTRKRMEDIRKLNSDYSVFHSKGMEAMRDHRELGEIDFYTRLHKDPERVKQLTEIRENREREKQEKEKAEEEKKKLELAKEEYRLQGLEEDLKEEERQLKIASAPKKDKDSMTSSQFKELIPSDRK